MMMRILEAGGLPPLTDGIRTADRDNPNGYYEFEPVKQTARDVSWLAQAEGRAGCSHDGSQAGRQEGAEIREAVVQLGR